MSQFQFSHSNLRRITTFYERHSVFTVVPHDDVMSEFQRSDVTLNVACELSKRMGKIEFSSIAKNRINYIS